MVRIDSQESLWNGFTDGEGNRLLLLVGLVFLHVFHLFLQEVDFFQKFEVGFFLSGDDAIALFELILGHFQVLIIFI